jgi:hypothetical protein
MTDSRASPTLAHSRSIRRAGGRHARQPRTQRRSRPRIPTESKHFDHKAYYPGARQLYISVTGDRSSGKLLGAQILGHWQAEVAKRIDVYATALFHGMDVDLDLSYTLLSVVLGTRCRWPRRHGAARHRSPRKQGKNYG